jgi:hypothetical protein
MVVGRRGEEVRSRRGPPASRCVWRECWVLRVLPIYLRVVQYKPAVSACVLASVSGVFSTYSTYRVYTIHIFIYA